MSKTLLRRPNFAALVAIAWLMAALVLLIRHWPPTADTLAGGDDAMRLVQWRAWLGGRGWFDLTEPRLQPPLGYESHWSRLVDAGLAGLYLLFQPFVGAAAAERLMRAWWPLLWLLPAIAAVAAIAWRIAGREAASVALLLAMAGAPAYQPFTPGRIADHNVQIALALLVVATTVWSDRKRWAAAAAGALSGLALSVGFESLPCLAVCGAVLALRYAIGRDGARSLRDYGLALAATTAMGFLISVGPDHWLRPQCDAIAVNSAGAAAVAGLMLAFAGWLDHKQALNRTLAAVGAGTFALAVLLLIERRCIGGPFALVDPAIWPASVQDLQPWLALLRDNPLTAVGIAAFPVVALAAGITLARDPLCWRDLGFLTAAAAFLVAVATSAFVVRVFPYAIWLGMPLVAAAALRWLTLLRLKTALARLAAATALTPMVLSAGVVAVAAAAGVGDRAGAARLDDRACSTRVADYAALGRLPVGLVAADIDDGPSLLALTPHPVLAAPYHRLSRGIVEARRAFAVPPDEARPVLQAAKVAYVVVCARRKSADPAGTAPERGLRARLAAGDIPDWLEPTAAGEVFVAYRLKPS